MKNRLFTIGTAALFAATILTTSCTGTTEEAKITSLEDIDRKAGALKEAILGSTFTPLIEGKTYYVSAQGDDGNDGLSPQKPLRSLDGVNALELQKGDGVLFRRGDLWRGHLQTRTGATYAAYGEGEKPRLYGSPCNAAQEGTWTETEARGVYAYSLELKNDVGALIFDDGAAGCAFKVMKVTQPDGTTTHVDTGQPFADYRDLRRDLDFYHDYKGTGLVYLRSDKGNPAERFRSIEMNVRGNLVRAVSDVHINNLCLKYCGSHAIGAGTVKSLCVSDCEIGWVGGSIQGEGLFGRNLPTRYGNGVEIYGGCDCFMVDSCYIYQVYDAAITHQHLGDGRDPILMRNVYYTHNLVEDCVYSFEYFLGRDTTEAERLMDNILIAENIARRTGMGWGSQRPDKETPAQVKSWVNHNRASNFLIAQNVFDRSTHDLLNITADSLEWLPRLEGNVYVQQRGGAAGKQGYNRKDREGETDPFWNSIRSDDMRYPFDEKYTEVLKHLFGEEDGTVIVLED